MFKSILEVIKESGISVPTWIYIITLIVLILAGVGFLLRKYIVPFCKTIYQRHKDILEIPTILAKQQQLIAQDVQIENEIKNLGVKVDKIVDTVHARWEKEDQAEMSRSQDRLLEMYKYYTAPERKGEWTSFEAEAFWNMFQSYTNAGGNSYMHTHIEPAMRQLTEIKMH